MAAVKETEAEIAGRLMEYLQQWGFDCYPEVAPWGGGAKRCDIVAVREPIVMAVEVKTRMSSVLLMQAKSWIGLADYVVAASPATPAFSDPVYQHFAKYHGIGMLAIPGQFDYPGGTYLPREHSRWWLHHISPFLDRGWNIPPRKQRRRRGKSLKDHLHEDMKRYNPGTPAGFSSPWKRTMDQCVALIHKTPGLSVRELVAKVEHHYKRDSTARSSIPAWLQRDPRVEVRHEPVNERSGFRFYPTEADSG